MKLSDNRVIIQIRLQGLQVYVFIVALLGTSHMAQLCAEQHQSRISIEERLGHRRTSTVLTVRSIFSIRVVLGKSSENIRAF